MPGRAQLVAALALAGAAVAGRPVDVLVSVGGLPAHLAGVFEEPLAFQQVPSGDYLVFDRRAHAVYRVDRAKTEAVKIVSIGPEGGRLLGPTAFDSGPDGFFVVADAPNLVERLQFFNEQGQKIGAFSLPGRAAARVTLGTLVLSGVGSVEFTGRSLLVNLPETGGLVTEFGLAGTPVRTFGQLRPTGHESDRDLHLALNVGMPLVNPTGGFYFVFTTGEPRFRKYDQRGQLVFERVIQGREIDPLLASQPSAWPRRTVGGQELPLVLPFVRTAAVDRQGRLWVSFVAPFTYVFDEDGDRLRTVQFRAAGLVSPTSLFFSANGRLLITPGLYEFDPK